MNNPYCKVRQLPGEPVQIYGFLGKEDPLPCMVYTLDDAGNIARSSQQLRPLTMSEIGEVDAGAEIAAAEWRADNGK